MCFKDPFSENTVNEVFLIVVSTRNEINDILATISNNLLLTSAYF